MKQFRKIIFWLHLISGVTAGVVIFAMCATGALLSFESNILAFAESRMRSVESPIENVKKISLREILEKAQAEKPEAKLSGVTLQNEPNAALQISFGRQGQVFINPFTGEILGNGAENLRAFFQKVEDIHRWLAFSGSFRPLGKAIADASNLLFLFLAVSGVYIWFPRRLTRQNFKQILWFRSNLNGRARNFNWHNVIGFWSSSVLIVLTLTAVVMSYQWANNLLYALTGNDVPQQQQAAANQAAEESFILPENLDQISSNAENHTVWKSISLRLPITKNTAVFTVEEGIYWNKFARSTLSVNSETAEITKWEAYGEQNAGRQLRSWVRFTHTGETGGIVGQTIGFIACIGGTFLVWTGLSLAWRRFNNWRSKSGKL